MTKITTDFVGNETTAVTKQRLTDILAYWGASTAAYTTWGQARTALNALLTSTTAGTIGSTELAGSFLPKINFLNDPDDMIADALFGAGEQGVWLDPSDLTTMFQDAAGTTPVTAPGQPVGLRLDKSKGLVLGSELVTNGDFAGGTTGWTGAWTVSGGVATGTPGGAALQGGGFSAIVGRTYLLQFDILAASFLAVTLGGVAVGSFFSAQTVRRYVVASSATGISFSAGGAANSQIDNISVKELPGNHATQSTAGSRPMYGIEPKGGRRNLLTWSEQFDNAAWTKGNATVTANSSAGPTGSTDADKLIADTASASHFANQAFTPVVGTYTASAYVKADGYNFCAIQVIFGGLNVFRAYNLTTGAITASAGTGTDATPVNVGNGWWRFAVTVTTLSTGPDGFRVRVENNGTGANFSGDGTSGILIWGAQLELGSTATPYQRVTTAFDVTEAGVNTCHYCQYDGSDDGMVTNSIDFTATDKMSVFAGVRKLSDATVQTFVELSAAADSNNGAFYIRAPESASKYSFLSRGTGNASAIYNGSLYSAPTTNVLTAVSDISGDVATLRINGTQAVQSTTDQGTGNYGNYPLYIGRRGGSSLPFNGRDYGIIVTGKLANATAIATTEMWLANKTSGVSL